MTIFTRMTGQDFNLGDTALRRAQLSLLATDAPYHVYVKDHSVDYVAALALRPQDVVYRDEAGFTDALDAYCRRGRVVLLDKPGAFKGTHRFGRWWTSRLRTALDVRRTGGLVLNLGSGIQDRPDLRQRAILRLFALPTDMLAWRDTGSKDWFGCGKLMPDWAFALPASGHGGQRRFLGISLRGERAFPDETWFEAVEEFCEGARLEPVAISQVRIDNDHAEAAAKRLGCRAVVWEGQTHLEQEQAVRNIYATCALVVSDRLHVLILAVTEGAAPACLLPIAENKIARHFEVIGLRGIAADTRDWTKQALISALEQAAANRAGAAEAQAGASAAVERVAVEAKALISRCLGRAS
jgi:hypothetical protein